MKFAAKPTVYKDTLFRSRLEAKWAAFFDLAGWRWEYEPYDLDGWTPDFLIHGVHPILCEVKPIVWQGDCDIDLRAHASDLVKVYRHVTQPENWGDQVEPEIAILGNAPMGSGGIYHSSRALGVFLYADGGDVFTDPAVFFQGYSPRVLDVASDVYWFGYRVGGEADGDHHLQPIYGEPIDKLWRVASRETQARKPKYDPAPHELPHEFKSAGRITADLVAKLGRAP